MKRRWWWRALGIGVALGVLAVGVLALRLRAGPIALGFLDGRIAAALDAAAPGVTAAVEGTALARAGRGVALRTAVRILGRDGTPMLALPAVAIRPSLGALLRGRLVIARVDVAGAALALTRREDGTWLVGSHEAVALLGGTGGGAGGQTGLPRLHLAETAITIDDRRAGGRIAIAGGDLLLSLRDHTLHVALRAALEVASERPPLPRRLALPIRAEASAPVAADGTIGDVALAVSADGGEVALVGDVGRPFALGALAAEGTYRRGAETLQLARLAATVGTARLAAAATLVVGTEPAVAFEGTVDALPLAHLTRLWPAELATAARSWLATNLHAGELRGCRVALALQAAEGAGEAAEAGETAGASGSPVDDASVAGRARVGGAASAAPPRFDIACDFTGVTADYLPPLDPIRGASGRARITAAMLDVTVRSGTVGGCRVDGGTLAMDLTVDPPRATIAADVAGATAEVLALVDQPPLRIGKGIGLVSADAGGESQVRVEIGLPITSALAPGDVAIRATAALHAASLPNLAGGVGIADGALEVRVDGAAVDVEGTTRLTGLAAVTTPVTVRIRAVPAPAGGRDVTVTLDGEEAAGHGTMTVVDGAVAALVIEHLRVAGSEVTGRLGRRADGAVEATLAGAVLDLERLLAEPVVAGGGEPGWGALDYAVTVDLGRVRGENGLDLRDVRGSIAGRGRDVRALDLAGAFAPAPEGPAKEGVAPGRPTRAGAMERPAQARRGPGFAAVVEPGGGRRRVAVTAEDAGRLLQAVARVEQIAGGSLALEALTDARGPAAFLEGALVLRDFRVQRAPVLAKILGIGSLGGIAALVQGDGMPMREARFPFRWEGTRLALGDVRAVGAVGLTADGVLDTGAGTVDLRGNVIPAYTLNSALGRVPLLGRFLVGGQGEGVFGIDYRVRGQTTDPAVTVNPLTSVAPTVLRRWFVEPFQRR